MIKKIKSLFFKLKKEKTKKKVVNKQDTYKRLIDRYKEKIKIEFLNRIPREKEIVSKISQNKFIVYVDKSKGPNYIFGRSKYCSFKASMVGNSIYFLKIKNNPNNKNHFRNLYDIKLFNDFLINYAKKEKMESIKINTWIFEEFKGFSKFLGRYEPNMEHLKEYRQNLLDNKYKKVLGYNFEQNEVYGVDLNNKFISITIKLPEYILKIKR